MYIDGKFLSSLQISEGLKGRAETQIQITGTGSGATLDEAQKSANEEMKKLQTVLITGSLPFKLQIVKLDTISQLSVQILQNIFFLRDLFQFF